MKLTVTIPVYNRARLVARAIESCLAQGSGDFEILVVNDGSTDETADVVSSYRDPRLRMLTHPVNLGVCPSRATAFAAARGAWCVWLDSDFTLLPDALAQIERRCAEAPDDVGNVASACTWDIGPETPDPLPASDLTLDYLEYLRFFAGLRQPEYFNVTRREVHARIPMPPGRAHELSFHFALAKSFRFRFVPERFVRIHTDAAVRLTAAPPREYASLLRMSARDFAADAEVMLAEHGTALRVHAPPVFAATARIAVWSHLVAGNRRAALHAFGRAFPALSRSARTWADLVLGVASPWALAQTRAYWQYHRYVRPRRASLRTDAAHSS